MGSFPTHMILSCIVCILLISGSLASLTIELLKNQHVIISAPQDVTVFLTSPSKIIVSWTLPEVYVPHDVSEVKFSSLKNGDKLDVMKPLFRYEPLEVPKNVTKLAETSSSLNKTDIDNSKINFTQSMSGDQPSEVSNLSTSTTTTTTTTNTTAAEDQPTADQPKAGDKLPITINEIACHPLEYFANYTVGFANHSDSTGPDQNYWSLSLLDSSIQVTNMSLYVRDNQHKLVAFDRGCVKKFVVTYNQVNARPYEQQIELNASDHLATLTGLKARTEYKVVVTAHFVSGDAIAAKAIYVTTLEKGPARCKCDWHGTENRTSDCEMPSTDRQHCQCNPAYQGRFCEECGPTFYRDRKGSGCKPCPCNGSRCGFVEGYLKCDSCPKGYTGNVCHKCEYGYFMLRRVCYPCDCRGNTHPDAPIMCRMGTGSCIDCQHNTTGFNCERCLGGYRRVPNNSSGICTPLTLAGAPALHKSSSSSGVSTGIIGAVALVACAVIIVAIGVFLCRRARINRQLRAMWTVEMRPDNDDVDFNSVPNDDARMDDVADLEFYDRHSGRSRGGGKYSKLEEEC